MEYIDTDLDGIREIVCMYKEVMESIKSLRRITQKIQDEFETDTEGALRRIQTIDDERLVDITNVRHRVEDGYENVLKVFERLEKNDFQQPLLKLQEILEDYHDMHLQKEEIVRNMIRRKAVIKRNIHGEIFLIDITQNYFDDECFLYQLTDRYFVIWCK